MRSETSFLPLTPVVFDILISLGDGARHGYAMMKEIESRTGTAVRPGSLYRALGRLLDEGLLEEVPSEASDDAAERRRRYRLTRLGRRVARAEASRMASAVASARATRLLGGASGT